MTSSPRSTKDDFKQSRFSTQTLFPTALSPNHALVTVAQEVAERLQQAYPPPSDDNNSVEAIVISAVASDLRQIILTESLTDRELEVLQWIVDGENSIAIARKLNISVNAAKTHIHNILEKFILI
jgi:DNA-binding CsgD family transcriptional regulator